MEHSYYYWTNLYPDHVVIRKEGIYYTARNESAGVLHDILGFNLAVTGKNTVLAGSPNIDVIVEALRRHKLSYILIEGDEITERADFDFCDFKSAYRETGLKVSKKSKYKDLRAFAQTLLDGIDPVTGEILAEDDLMASQEMKDIINIAKKRIDSYLSEERPASAGMKWTEEEDEKLREEYTMGLSVKEIAGKHGRTNGAVTSRIIKLFPQLLNENNDKK